MLAGVKLSGRNYLNNVVPVLYRKSAASFVRFLSFTKDMSYATLIQNLYKTNMFNPNKVNLENMMKLNDLLGDPMKEMPIIHVTGTNGKGSVTMKLYKCLRETGTRTGLFTSPHISSFKERIVVDEQLLSESDVQSILPEVFKHCTEHTIPATFFELTTALGMVHFKRSSCEAVVLEVGMGGRLDSTNIVTPSLSIITAIQLDHTKILGDTIEKIATEKAGIMKRGVDALVGPGCPIELMRAEAQKVGANFYTLDDVLEPHERRFNTSLPASETDIDDLNTDIAHAALRLLQRQRGSTVLERLSRPDLDFERALRSRPMCRFEVFKLITSSSGAPRNVHVILDIAHNEDALRTLTSKVRLVYGSTPVRVVMGMSSDKDVSSCIPFVVKLVDHDASRIHCVAASHPRALKTAELRKLVDATIARETGRNGNDSDGAALDGEIGETIRRAVDSFGCVDTDPSKQGPDGVVVVCGTAFIMSDARQELGVVEPRDSEDLFFDLSKPK